jgi:hypothetical protein
MSSENIGTTLDVQNNSPIYPIDPIDPIDSPIVGESQDTELTNLNSPDEQVSEKLSTEEKLELNKISNLLEETAISLTTITTNLSSYEPDIEQAVNDLKAAAEKLQSENPLKGGKSRRKAYKNKKKNKTKKGGRKSKKNQKNKR